jgi:branched-chain amino acid transport system permease protein
VLILQLVVDGVLLAGIYLLMAQSLNLIFGVMRIVNFAQGTMIAVSGLFTVWFATHAKVNPFVATPAAFAAMFVIGALVERLLLRRITIRGTQGELMTLMVTFGVSYVLINFALKAWGSEYVSLPYLQTSWHLGAIDFPKSLVVAGIFGAVLSAALYGWLNYTGSGLALLATAQSRVGAGACGIDAGRTGTLAFALGSALAAVAGSVLVLVTPLGPQSGNDLTILCFVVIALGGLGDQGGAVLGALVLGLAQSIFGYYLGGNVQVLLPYILLILIMLFVPRGLSISRLAR